MSQADPGRDTKQSFEARSNSVKQLCDLYRVVIAIAVGLAFHNIIDELGTPIPVKLDQIVTFLALIVTVIPFFHGAVRHLFATYVEHGGSTQIKNWAILIDYYLLFMEGGLFVALASTLGDTKAFLVILTLLLSLDCVWGILATIGFAGSRSQKAEIKWAVINFFAASVLLALLLFAPVLSQLGLTDNHLQWVILLIASVRTMVDYGVNLAFYCP